MAAVGVVWTTLAELAAELDAVGVVHFGRATESARHDARGVVARFIEASGPTLRPIIAIHAVIAATTVLAGLHHSCWPAGVPCGVPGDAAPIRDPVVIPVEGKWFIAVRSKWNLKSFQHQKRTHGRELSNRNPRSRIPAGSTTDLAKAEADLWSIDCRYNERTGMRPGRETCLAFLSRSAGPVQLMVFAHQLKPGEVRFPMRFRYNLFYILTASRPHRRERLA